MVPARLPSMSSSKIYLRDELGLRREIEVGDLEEVLRRPDVAWERGSGDCGLTRAQDEAMMSFILRPALGMILIYEETESAYQLVYGQAAGLSAGGTAVVRIGGDEVRVPRAWFVSVSEGRTVLHQFMLGRRFEEGPEWCEYLVNSGAGG